MSDSGSRRTAAQGDLLLWGGVALLGLVVLTWLLLARPWSQATAWTPSSSAVTPGDNRTPPAASATADGVSHADDIANPLRMADLAYQAGMLLEPEGYSAWDLYQRAGQRNPDDESAATGLLRVADDITARGLVAAEQGRTDDATALATRVLAVMPGHEGAQGLMHAIEAIEARDRAAMERARERASMRPPEPPDTAADSGPAPAGRDDGLLFGGGIDGAGYPTFARVEAQTSRTALEVSFSEALAANRLLTPETRSAKHYLHQLLTVAPEHVASLTARQQLLDALLDRAADAIASLDADAAMSWLDEAQALTDDPSRLTAMRDELTSRLIAAESERLLPTSALTLINYVVPAYPARALDRRVEGWVDIEFIVDTEGRPRDLVVTDGSDEYYFRGEARRAVEQWRFEPRQFMGHTISQRSYTRIRFALED